MSQVRVRGGETEAEVPVARLERLLGRNSIGELYLAGRLRISMDPKTWEEVRRDPVAMDGPPARRR
ncbi:MAG TPA: hypothetical protein VHN99_01845 [Deinococcales bacterium]|nr:hypothetical protein [Deinococcales bacterium]